MRVIRCDYAAPIRHVARSVVGDALLNERVERPFCPLEGDCNPMYCGVTLGACPVCFSPDPAVGAEPGEVPHGSVPDALLPGQPAGR